MQGLGRPGTVALSANIVQELEQLDVVDLTYRPATYEGKHIFGERSGQDSIVFFCAPACRYAWCMPHAKKPASTRMLLALAAARIAAQVKLAESDGLRSHC